MKALACYCDPIKLFPVLSVFHWVRSSIRVQVWPAPFWFPSFCLAPISHARFCPSRFAASFCTRALLSRFYFVWLCRRSLYKSRIAIWDCKKIRCEALTYKSNAAIVWKTRGGGGGGGVSSVKWSHLTHFHSIPS